MRRAEARVTKRDGGVVEDGRQLGLDHRPKEVQNRHIDVSQ